MREKEKGTGERWQWVFSQEGQKTASVQKGDRHGPQANGSLLTKVKGNNSCLDEVFNFVGKFSWGVQKGPFDSWISVR